MMDVHAVGLFCEDIREEKSGLVTLVGVLPDNIRSESLPGLFPKLGIYVRAHFFSKTRPDSLEILILAPNGAEVVHVSVEDDALNKAWDEAAIAEDDYVGIISKINVSPFQFNESGTIKLILRVNGEKDFFCGKMRIHDISANS
ncbi:MAG: hypothetical protein KJ587_04345 [Alphaproteobacteria bacterium]|nr:hypothetical protein [Alphaproteobacteria bacterium]